MPTLPPPDPTRNPFLEQALQYAARGWPVFPLVPGTKEPFAGSHGFKDATTDPEKIRHWWAKTPDANVGIATGAVSGVFVLDADLHRVPECLKELEKRHGALPKTYTVATARNGRHYYFQMPPGRGVRCGTDKLDKGLDVKGDGGYVVAPPSIFEGGTYKVLNATPPATPPEWLVDLVALQRDRGTEGTEKQKPSLPLCLSVSLSTPSPLNPVRFIEDAVRRSLPQAEHQNDRCLLTLARALINGFTPAEKMSAFDQWYKQTGARGLLRQGQSRDTYLAQFLHAVKSAKFPLGQGPMDRVWALACKEPWPPEAAMFESVEAKRIVALCFQLQRLSGGKPWPLACRVLTRYAGMNPTDAARWLSALVGAGILHVAERNTTTRAIRYRYIGTEKMTQAPEPGSTKTRTDKPLP